MSNSINPQSEVILLNVSIQNDMKNQYTFSSLSEQTAFFLAKNIGKHFTNLTFVRDGVIAVESQIYDVYNANYMMFKNNGFKDKWFYAFITDVEYVNENTAYIHWTMDYFQTWYFNITYHDSFIIREHVADDTIGMHTIDESLELGEYKYRKIERLVDFSTLDFLIVTSEPSQDNTEIEIKIIDNNPTGLYYYYIRNEDNPIDTIKQFLTGFKNKINAVLYIQAIPSSCRPDTVVNSDLPLPNGSKGKAFTVTSYGDTSDIDGYYPKNNKIYTFPFCVLELTNQKGQSATYRPNDFLTYGTNTFQIVSNISGNPSVSIFPAHHKGGNNNLEFKWIKPNDGITFSNFPQVPWSSDYYETWYAQNGFGNSVQMDIGIGQSIGSFGFGLINLISGNPVGAGLGVVNGMGSLAQTIGNNLNEKHKADVTPNQAHGNSSNVNSLISHGVAGFYLNYKNISYQYAKIIDDYFSMFGYRVNRLGSINLRTRTNWNYIETANINITGNIPQTHLNAIKSMFNNGVTLWHNDNVGNYSRANSIR